ncbi:MAG TPA: polysaccharide biosynthesis tyrosine autokinase, partial [Candidatus Kapabacteria bacterium]|nr:polysaccharide biosynthesis tyrosine autokinase [Candidatus Kapabacteria bacterium]
MGKNEYGEMEKVPGLNEEEKIQLEEYWELIKRRKNILIYFSLFAVAVAMTWTFMQAPVYEAKGTLMIEPDQRNVLMFPDAYALQNNIMDEYLVTQVKILKSRTLARSVLEDLQMVNKSGPPKKTSIGPATLLSFFKKKEISKDGEMTAAINGFLGILAVEIIPDSRLVEVSYTSTNPELCAKVVNTLFDKYVNFNLRIKTESIQLASEFLTTQIDDLRKALTQKERELQDYGKRKELFYLSGEETTVVEKFADLNTAFTEAQIFRINKESIYRELKNKKFADYPQVSSDALIQGLKKEHSVIETDYKRKTLIFKDSYPEMQRLISQMNYLQERIDAESLDRGRKALQEAEAEYQTAKKKEDSLAGLLNRQKQDVVATNTSAIYYNSLKIEVTNMRNLLDHLIKKQKESMLTSRLEGLQTSNIKIIDLAEVPISNISPKKKSTFIFAILIGIFGGLGLVFLLDWLDKTIKTPEQVEKILKLPSLGFIPAIGAHSSYAYSQYPGKNENPGHEKKLKEIEFANYLEPGSIYAENYRNIRTSILLSTPGHFPRLMTVTSAMPQEGKTATVVNLAISFTNLDKKVLIIDADLREPRIHKIFNIKNTAGLSSVLAGKCLLEEVLVSTEIKNLSILPSG